MPGLNEFNFKQMISKKKKCRMPTTNSGEPSDDKTAINFLLKRTKRFDYPIRVVDTEPVEAKRFKHEVLMEMDTEDEEMNGIDYQNVKNIPSSLECLFHSSLCQNNTWNNQENTLENKENIPENQKNPLESEPNSEFPMPKVYKCHYCQKVFFHSLTYRRHMIRQLQKLSWCLICKRGFISKTTFKKHKLLCHTQ